LIIIIIELLNTFVIVLIFVKTDLILNLEGFSLILVATKCSLIYNHDEETKWLKGHL